MDTEEFKPMYGFEETYEINIDGIVRRISNEFILKRQLNANGYNYIGLYYKNKRYYKKISRLIALTFLEVPPNDKYQVNHKNGIKTDDRLENLEWVTPKENTLHAVYVLGNHNRMKLKISDVLEIRRLLDNGISSVEISRMYNVDKSNISRIKTRDIWCYI